MLLLKHMFKGNNMTPDQQTDSDQVDNKNFKTLKKR